jgi:two-component system phosphate regulon response regulator PhoB
MDRKAIERILVVDDEADLRNLLHFNLRVAGYEVDAVGTGADALRASAANPPTVLVLDIMLPDLSGTEVCRRLRADPALHDIAVMMLTARDDEHDRVLGFEAGTDDYVAKPFEVAEVVTRVRMLVRCARERRQARLLQQSGDRLRWRGLEVDAPAHRTWVDGQEVVLRPLEFKLLSLFLENPARVFTRGQLLKEIWGAGEYASATTVSTHLKRLRDRLGVYAPIIETVHGYGYRLGDAAA